MLPECGKTYGTKRQNFLAKGMGGRIKRGSHAHLVVYFKLLPKREATEDRDEWGAIPLLRYYNVFALADTEGIQIGRASCRERV